MQCAACQRALVPGTADHGKYTRASSGESALACSRVCAERRFASIGVEPINMTIDEAYDRATLEQLRSRDTVAALVAKSIPGDVREFFAFAIEDERPWWVVALRPHVNVTWSQLWRKVAHFESAVINQFLDWSEQLTDEDYVAILERAVEKRNVNAVHRMALLGREPHPFIVAIQKDRLDLAALLMKPEPDSGLIPRYPYRLNVRKRDAGGELVIFHAIRAPNPVEAVKLVLEYGASPRDVNPRGETPLSLATKLKLRPVAQLLVANGADLSEDGNRDRIAAEFGEPFYRELHRAFYDRLATPRAQRWSQHGDRL